MGSRKRGRQQDRVGVRLVKEVERLTCYIAIGYRCLFFGRLSCKCGVYFVLGDCLAYLGYTVQHSNPKSGLKSNK